MPPARTGKSLNAQFNIQHTNTYGLKVMERCASTSQVVSVRCQFCIYYGPEIDPAQPRQRASNTTKKAWSMCFRPDLYQHHHKTRHPAIWEKYQACSYDEKAVFSLITKFHSKIPCSLISTLDQAA